MFPAVTPSPSPDILAEAESALQSFLTNLSGAVDQTVLSATTIFLILIGLIVLLRVIEAVIVGCLARGKGYSFFGNFVLGLFFGIFALIYEAGRPVSYERECVMQDRMAMQVAKEMYKLQRARERSQQERTIRRPD